MENNNRNPNRDDRGGQGRRASVVGILALLLVVVTVIVLQTIERAPSAGGGGPAGTPGGMPPAAVYVVTVVQEMTREKAIVTGTLKAVSQAGVAAREPGAVEEVFVDEGEAVKKGGVLARLDTRRTQAMLAEAKARLTSAKSLLGQRAAEMARAGEDLRMKRGLRERNVVSQSDLLDAEKATTVAKLQLDVASDGIKEAESRINLLEVQLSDSTILAPFDGVVVDRRVEPGEWVGAGAVVASLVAVDPIEAWLRVPARYLGGTDLEAGAFRVRQSSTRRVFETTKVEKVPQVEPLSQLFVVVATVQNPKRDLTPGESVTGIVPVGKIQAFWRVPANAVVPSPLGDFVYVAQTPAGDGAMPAAKKVPVKVAFERGGNAFIAAEASGIKDGDRIVVEGNERLMPGQPLMIKSAEETATVPAP